MSQPVQWKVSLPPELAANVEEELFDPLMGRSTYGSRSRLITHLLDDWLSARRNRTQEDTLVPSEEFTS